MDDHYRADSWANNSDHSSYPYHSVSKSSYANENHASAQQARPHYSSMPGQMNYPPPLPLGPPPGPSSQMYHFGQAPDPSYSRDSAQFKFQPINRLPSYPTRQPSPNRYHNYNDRYDRSSYRHGQDRRNRDGYDRPRFEKRVRMAADRPLLHTRRDNTPDQFEGMANENNDIPKFRDVENMSDSDSEVMDESQSENETDVKKPSKLAVEEAKSAPRWSNPEPYTSLPPPEASKKRKDVVKLIRKARIAAAKSDEQMKQLAQNDDFISFGFEEEQPRAPQGHTTGTSHDHQVGSNGQAYQSTIADVKGNGETKPKGRVFDVVPNNIAFRLANYERKFSLDDLDKKSGIGGSNTVPSNTASKPSKLKRKRSSSDVGDKDVVLNAPKRQKTLRSQPTGAVLDEWMAKDPADCTPWAVEHQWTENAGFRLHKEICDFYDFVRPHYFEKTMRLDLLGRIRKTVKAFHQDCDVHAFGSFAAGLYLPDADLDLVIISRDFISRGQSSLNSSKVLFKLSAWFVTDGIAAKDSVEVIVAAKVPLIKFRDLKTGIRVDVSFENLTGPKAVLTFRHWKAAYPAMPILITVIKQFLMMRGLNEVVNGGLGGFSVTCLITALLQNMPRVQSGDLIPEENLGEILLEFLDLYGNQFDLYATAIDFNPPRFVDKARVTTKNPEKREERLYIVDPNDHTNDISGGSKNVGHIFKLFSYARKEILNAMQRDDPVSFLAWMLGGDYGVYFAQRDHLKQLYKTGKWIEIAMDDELEASADLVKQRAGTLPVKMPAPPKRRKPPPRFASNRKNSK